MKALLGTSNDENGPLWARVLYRYGVPSAIALFLVYSLAHGVSVKLDAMDETLLLHVEEQRVYLRAICLHTAHSEAERVDCIPLSPGMRSR